jgi:hypothetical protein
MDMAKTNTNSIVAGLQNILDRIPHIRGIHLDQAMEYCKHPYAAVVTYPFAAQTNKKTRDETGEQPGTASSLSEKRV